MHKWLAVVEGEQRGQRWKQGRNEAGSSCGLELNLAVEDDMVSVSLQRG